MASRYGLGARKDGSLTVTELDPQRIGVPDVPVPLPAGHLACLACGIAVPASRDGLVVAEAIAREGQPPRAPRPGATTVLRTEFLRCDACADRLEVVHRLLDAHPRIRLRLGDDTAEHQMECALLALAVLGHAASEDTPEAVLLSLLRHLTPPGAAARWLARFAPVVVAGAAPGTCSPYPWAHIRHGLRQQLREGYAAVLRDRVAANAPPVRLPPPEIEEDSGAVPVSGGCLLCGVDAVALPASRVAVLGGREEAQREVWRRLTAASPASLGGVGPDRITGHVCPACADALNWVGSIGPTAMKRALIEHLRAAGSEDEADRLREGEIEGLVGWGALAYAAMRSGSVMKSSSSRWGHLWTQSGRAQAGSSSSSTTSSSSVGSHTTAGLIT